jgi:hypothetical protein
MNQGQFRAAAFGIALTSLAACSGAGTPEPAAGSAAPPEGSARAPRPANPPGCDKELVVELVGTTVWKLPGGSILAFKAGMTIDADGAPKAYHKDDSKALDTITNAGKEALVTENGKPVVQGPGDPAPGYFVSKTSLFDKNKPARSPGRYVDASTIPYIALPPDAKEWGAQLGDFVAVLNAKNGRLGYAIYADVGPPAKLGAGSIALAEATGIASSPKEGGVPYGVIYAVFLKSGNGAPRSAADIDKEGKRLLDAAGGRTTLAKCFR